MLNVSLLERVNQLKELRMTMERACEDANRLYDRKCREVWRADPEVRAHRDAIARLRRRERRLERTVEQELEGLLGPEPD